MKTRRGCLLIMMAISATALFSGSAFSQIQWPLRPFNQPHELNKAYGDWIGYEVYQTDIIRRTHRQDGRRRLSWMGSQ